MLSRNIRKQPFRFCSDTHSMRASSWEVAGDANQSIRAATLLKFFNLACFSIWWIYSNLFLVGFLFVCFFSLLNKYSVVDNNVASECPLENTWWFDNEWENIHIKLYNNGWHIQSTQYMLTFCWKNAHVHTGVQVCVCVYYVNRNRYTHIYAII